MLLNNVAWQLRGEGEENTRFYLPRKPFQLCLNHCRFFRTPTDQQNPNDATVSISFLQLPTTASGNVSHSSTMPNSHSNASRMVAKVKRPTGTTAARILAEQYSKTRISHASQTDAPTSIKRRDRRGVRPRLPPKKDSCLLCHTEVPDNQRDRHVLRSVLKLCFV